ncbi:MAG: hypothetical protein HY744_31400 [Deltaproteobacteria bacterium]|nr:hypothetical protein [Deltaproteobacteria bacterium]
MKRSLWFVYTVILSFFVGVTPAPLPAYAEEEASDTADVYDEDEDVQEQIDEFADEEADEERPSCKDAIKSLGADENVQLLKAQRAECKQLRQCKHTCRKDKREAKQAARAEKRDCKKDCKAKKGKDKRACKKECRQGKREAKREARAAKSDCVQKCRKEHLIGGCKEARGKFLGALGKWAKGVAGNKECQDKAKELFAQVEGIFGGG